MNKVIAIVVPFVLGIAVFSGCQKTVTVSETTDNTTAAGFAQEATVIASAANAHNGEASAISGASVSGADEMSAMDISQVPNTFIHLPVVVNSSTPATTLIVHVSTPDVNGWAKTVVLKGSWIRYREFRFLDSNGNPILADTLATLYAAANTPGTGAKTMDFKEDAASPRGTFSSDLVFTRDTAGEKGGVLNGTSTGTGPRGGTVDITYTNVRGNGQRECIGGTIQMVHVTPKGKTWTIVLTFNTDGSCSGTITGPHYSGTIQLNPDTSGSVSDKGGTQTLTPISTGS